MVSGMQMAARAQTRNVNVVNTPTVHVTNTPSVNVANTANDGSCFCCRCCARPVRSRSATESQSSSLVATTDFQGRGGKSSAAARVFLAQEKNQQTVG